MQPSRVEAASEAPQRRDDLAPQPREAPERRRSEFRLVLLGIVIAGSCAASAYFFSSRQETVYGARAEILYQASDAERALGTPRIMATQKIVIRSRTVLEPASAAVGVPLDELQDATSVEIAGESDVLRLTVADADRALALALAKEIADGYARTVAAASFAGASEGRRLLEARIATLQRRLTRVRTRLRAVDRARAGLPPSSEQQELQAEVQTLLERIGDLQDRLTELAVERVGQRQARARIITPAHILEDPLEPKPIRAAVAGLLVGLLLAAGLIALAHRRRRVVA